MKRMAKMSVTSELIANALAFPDDAEIIYIIMESPGIFTFYVEHPDFPVLKEAKVPIEIVPVFHCDYDKRPSTWITCDWNLSPPCIQWVCKDCYDKFDKEYEILSAANWSKIMCEFCGINAGEHKYETNPIQSS